jgi:hypothetical protein
MARGPAARYKQDHTNEGRERRESQKRIASELAVKDFLAHLLARLGIADGAAPRSRNQPQRNQQHIKRASTHPFLLLVK